MNWEGGTKKRLEFIFVLLFSGFVIMFVARSGEDGVCFGQDNQSVALAKYFDRVCDSPLKPIGWPIFTPSRIS